MRKEPHIEEFSAKKGNGYHVRVTTTRNKRRISVDGGRFYFADYGSKKDALTAARREREKILLDLNLHPINTAPTVEEIYEKSFDLIPLSIKTRYGYDYLYKNVPFKEKRITAVTLEDVQSAVSKFALTHAHGRTKRYISLYKRLYKTAFLLQLPVIDYSAMLSTPKSRIVQKHNVKEISYSDFMQFLDAVSDSRSSFALMVTRICWIMYYTGMRLQEVLALYESDIDINRKLIHVQRSVGSTASKSAQIVPLKTEKSDRYIPIAPALMPVIQTLIADCDDQLLFHDQNGEPIFSGKLSTYVCLTAKRNTINFSLYGLRHLFAADLFRQGTNPKVIQTLMGHTTENMSLYYAYTTEEEMKNAIDQRKPS